MRVLLCDGNKRLCVNVDNNEVRMSSPGFRKTLLTNELSTEELLGSMLVSKITSITSFSSFGAGNDVIFEVMKSVEGVSSNMWSLVPLTIRAASGNAEAKEIHELMIKQISEQLNRFMEVLKDIEEQTIEYEKNENIKH